MIGQKFIESKFCWFSFLVETLKMSEVGNMVSIVDATTGSKIKVQRPTDIDELKQLITKTFQIQEDVNN